MNLAERLGHPAGGRLIIVHIDDIGVSHAVNAAAFECLERGSATCGSVLVPCPWFPEVAEYCVAHPQADIGVHLTLNAEYAAYRWPPLTGREAAPGLYDEQGYMWRDGQQAAERITPQEAEREFRAQIEKALAADIDVTHIDSHMGTAFQPKFIGIYLALGQEYRLPIFLPRPNPELLRSRGMADLLEHFQALLRPVDEAGFPIIDHALVDTLGPSPEGKEAFFKGLFDGLKPGVTHFLIHPARPSEEMTATVEDADYRVRDYELFRDASMRRYLEASGARPIGYRELRDALRQGRLRGP